MTSLTIFEQDGTLWTDSRDVAEMVDKQHKHLLRDINGYIEVLVSEKTTEPNFGPSEFFKESTYLDSTGRELPCYLISQKGCEFIANKLTGKKGILFTAEYVNRFNDYKEQAARNGTLPAAPPKPALDKETRAKAMLMNAKRGLAQEYRKLYDAAGIKPEYQIMALQNFIGDDGPKLPAKALEATRVTYDKGTIAEKVGVYAQASGKPHAQAIGAIISV